MINQNSDIFKIRRAPNRKFYVWGNGEAISLPNGNLRYFETEQETWALLADRARAEMGKIAA